MRKKRVCISLPCFNEVENVEPLSAEIIEVFEKKLPEYDYELNFIDNCSNDKTQEKLRELCKGNKKIKAIFNTKNFGGKSGFYGCLQTYGDCTICMATDFQTPSEMIPVFIREWEKGANIVAGVKSATKEKFLKRNLRKTYYKIVKKFSDVDMIEQFTGFGLYDRKFVDFIRTLHDPMPTMRGIVAEFGYDITKVNFVQPPRRAGKSKHNFMSLLDLAISSFTTYTKIGIRMLSVMGFLMSIISFVIALVYLVLKLLNWSSFGMGTAPILIGVFLLGSIQLLFIGVIGEYIVNMNKRIIGRPLCVEKIRLNYTESETECHDI